MHPLLVLFTYEKHFRKKNKKKKKRRIATPALIMQPVNNCPSCTNHRGVVTTFRYLLKLTLTFRCNTQKSTTHINTFAVLIKEWELCSCS